MITLDPKDYRQGLNVLIFPTEDLLSEHVRFYPQKARIVSQTEENEYVVESYTHELEKIGLSQFVPILLPINITQYNYEFICDHHLKKEFLNRFVFRGVIFSEFEDKYVSKVPLFLSYCLTRKYFPFFYRRILPVSNRYYVKINNCEYKFYLGKKSSQKYGEQIRKCLGKIVYVICDYVRYKSKIVLVNIESISEDKCEFITFDEFVKFKASEYEKYILNDKLSLPVNDASNLFQVDEKLFRVDSNNSDLILCSIVRKSKELVKIFDECENTERWYDMLECNRSLVPVEYVRNQKYRDFNIVLPKDDGNLIVNGASFNLNNYLRKNKFVCAKLISWYKMKELKFSFVRLKSTPKLVRCKKAQNYSKQLPQWIFSNGDIQISVTKRKIGKKWIVESQYFVDFLSVTGIEQNIYKTYGGKITVNTSKYSREVTFENNKIISIEPLTVDKWIIDENMSLVYRNDSVIEFINDKDVNFGMSDDYHLDKLYISVSLFFICIITVYNNEK